MPPALEADVALVHIAAGAARVTPPAGTLAQAAPRRAARGRTDDMLLLSLGLSASQPLSPGLTDHLAHKASESFFLTSGSVTAALRAALAVVNDHLHDLNQSESGGLRVAGRMMLAVLRGGDLYLAQAGAGQSIIIRPGQVNRLGSEEAAERPLGQSVSPFVRYQHLQAQSGDVILLAPHAGPQWADPTLAGLLTLDLGQAVERLAAASPNDLTGLLFRITQPGMGAPVARGLPAAPRASSPGTSSPPNRAPARARPAASLALLAPLGRALAPATRALQSGFRSFGARLISLLGRMAPGLVETGQPGSLSPTVLAGTAIAVPVVIVLIASLIYFQRGRGEQFQEYLGQAQAAVVAAQLQADPLQARFYWDQARGYLDQAQRYGEGEDYSLLRQLVSESLDTIDNIARVEFRPLFSGGFGRGARLSSLAATAADLYVLDAAGPTIYHAWDTGRGYEIDKDFRCLKGAEGVEEMGAPIALAVQPEPGALGAEGVVALDADGTLLYCAPGQTPAVSQLTPPDTGFGRIEAIAVAQDVLYVLDPRANAVWMYDASGGLFSGGPGMYFADSVPDLKGAMDLAMTQEELFLLYQNGTLDRCRRALEDPTNLQSVRVDCERGLIFQDERPGGAASDHIPGAAPITAVYSPPPEPSLYFLDLLTGGVYHYSMRLVYQGLYLPNAELEGEVTALALGPPNDLYVAAGAQVYHIERPR
jgi:hypothetical protein